jgi:hypothetical protein
VVPAILLLGAAPFSDVWRSLVMFPLTGYRGIRASAYPSFSLKVKKLTHYLPFVFILAAIAVYALRRDRRKRISAALFVPLCALAGLLAIQNLAAAGWPHLTGALMAGLVLAGFVVESFWPSPKRAGKVAAFAFSLLFLVYIGCGWVEYRNKHIQGEWAPPGMERVGALKVNVEAFAPVVQVVDYLHGHTQERTGLFVGCPRYDIIYINDVVLYFLADRPCACRYEELHHGIATTSAVQQEIIRDLEDKRTPYVVIWSGAPRDENLVSSGIFDLQRYIERHYAPEAEFGDYEVLKRLP